MYAINDNGTLRLMESLPFRITLPDGFTRTSLGELDEKHLAELGIYPAKVDKPEIKPTQYYGEPKFAFDGNLVVVAYPVLEKSKEQVAGELATAQTAKLAELAEARWQAETEGLTLPDGTVIKTDRESQGLLTGAAFSCTLDTTSKIEWKGDKGKWVDLDPKSVLQIAGLVRAHVQACFSKERALGEKANACESVEEVQSISW